jgi:hypothetical protein
MINYVGGISYITQARFWLRSKFRLKHPQISFKISFKISLKDPQISRNFDEICYFF